MPNGIPSWRLKPGQVSLRHLVFQAIGYMAPAADAAAFLTVTASFAAGSTPLAVLLGGLLYATFLNTNYQFSKYTGSAAGYYGFVAKTFGGFWGAVVAYWYIWFQFFSLAAYGFLLFSSFVYYAFPSLSSISYLWIPLALVMMGLTLFMGYRGLRPSLEYAFISGVLEISFLLIASFIIMAKVGTGNSILPFTLAPINNSWSTLFFAMLFSTPLYAGTGTLISLAEEAKGTIGTVRRAVWVTIVLMIVSLVIPAYALTVGWGINNMVNYASYPDPGVLVFDKYLGPIGGLLLVAFTINSFLDSNVSLMSSVSRYIFSLGWDGLLPKWTAKLHPKYWSPYYAVILLEVIAIALALISGVLFGPSFGATVLFTINIFGLLATHGAANISLPFYVKRRVGRVNVITQVLLPAISTILIALIFYYSIVPLPSPPLNYAVLIGTIYLVVSTLVLYLYYRRRPEIFKQVGMYEVK